MVTKVRCHEPECAHNKELFCRCRNIELPFPHMRNKKHSCYRFAPKIVADKPIAEDSK